jgi:hypothetical protein
VWNKSRKNKKSRQKREARELEKRVRFQSLPYRVGYRDLGRELGGHQLAVHVTPDGEEFYFTHDDSWTNVFYVETPSRTRLRYLLREQ